MWCVNFKPMQGDTVNKESMKSKSNESEVQLEIEKMGDADKSEQRIQAKSSAVKSRNFDGSTRVEAYMQQFRACAQYYKWTEEESSVEMKCALSSEAFTLVWSQTNLEQLAVAQLQEVLQEMYGSAKQEKKFHAELRARRRKANEDLQTLKADISRLMSSAFPGDASSMRQKMAIDYFLDSLDDLDFEFKIRKSEPKTLIDAYTRALRLEMIRKKIQKRELVKEAPVKHCKHTRAWRLILAGRR